MELVELWEYFGPNGTNDVDSWANEAGPSDGWAARASSIDGWAGDADGVDGWAGEATDIDGWADWADGTDGWADSWWSQRSRLQTCRWSCRGCAKRRTIGGNFEQSAPWLV